MMKSIFGTLLALVGGTASADIPSLAQSFPGMTIGAAVEPEQLDSPLLPKHFNSLVAENAMKPAFIHPSENTWNFGPADAIANYARSHNMTMRGHTFVWYKNPPSWFFIDNGKQASRKLVLSRLQMHINTMIDRYKDVVHDWDVVNEVVDPSQPNCLRNDKWIQTIGPDYNTYSLH